MFLFFLLSPEVCLDTISILGHRRKLFCIAKVYFLPRDSEVCLHIVDCAFTSGKMNGESTNCGRCRNVKVTDFLKCHFLFFYVCNTFPADRRSSQVCRKSKKTSLPRTSWWEDNLATDICLLQNWYRKASLIIGPHHLKKSPHARNSGLFETSHQDLDITDPTSDRWEHIWYKHARQHGHANNYCAIMIDIEIDSDWTVGEFLFNSIFAQLFPRGMEHNSFEEYSTLWGTFLGNFSLWASTSHSTNLHCLIFN